MVFDRVKSVFRIFKRGHPDLYDALKEYCDKTGYNMSDVVASAVAAYLASDAEGKDLLVEKMAKRRSNSSIGSENNIREVLSLFRDFCGVMKEMFAAINEARAGMSVNALISDFKAVSEAMNEIQKVGSEAGKGSLEDLVASAIVGRILGGLGVSSLPSDKVKSGKGKVVDVSEEE